MCPGEHDSGRHGQRAFHSQVDADLQRGGVLRVTSSRLLARGFLAQRLSDFVAAHENYRVELLDYDDNPLAPLRAHESDLLLEHVSKLPEDLEALQVTTICAFFVMPKAWTHGWRRLRVKALRSRPFVSYVKDSSEERLQQHALELHDLAPETLVTASNAEALIALVAAGLGYSVVPAVEGIGPEDPRLSAFAIKHPEASFPVHALWRPTSRDNPLVQAMLDALVS